MLGSQVQPLKPSICDFLQGRPPDFNALCSRLAGKIHVTPY